jgi:hypothetical protein
MRPAGLVAACALLAIGCGALVGLGDEPTFDPDEARTDAAHDGPANGGDDGPENDASSSDAAKDAPFDVKDDGGPISCVNATLCLDFEDDGGAGGAAKEEASGGLVFVDDSASRSPTHSLVASVNALMSSIAAADWAAAGTYAPGIEVSLYYRVDSGFGTSQTPLGELKASAAQQWTVRIWLTPTAVELEWWNDGSGGLGRVTLAARGLLPWNRLAFVVRDDGVFDTAGKKILPAPPVAFAGAMEFVLGVLQNPTGAPAVIRFDDIVVRLP